MIRLKLYTLFFFTFSIGVYGKGDPVRDSIVLQYLVSNDGFKYDQEIFVITEDLNLDSVSDYLVSSFISGAWGNGGGEWEKYLSNDSSWEHCNRPVMFNHEASSVNRDAGTFYLYGKLNCCEGYFTLVDLSECRVNILYQHHWKGESGNEESTETVSSDSDLNAHLKNEVAPNVLFGRIKNGLLTWD